MKDNGKVSLAKLASFLANERTILAYIRTSLALVATGVALQRFFYKSYVKTLGDVLIILSVIVLVVGCLRFVQNQQKIKKQKDANSSASYID